MSRSSLGAFCFRLCRCLLGSPRDGKRLRAAVAAAKRQRRAPRELRPTRRPHRRRRPRRPPRLPPRPAALPAEGAQAEGAEAPEGEDAAQAAEWAQRDKLVNEPNTINGGTGLLKTQHAQTGAPGQFRLGFVTEWFQAGFLCTSSFPCNNGAVTSDTMSHVGGTLSLGASLAKLGAGTFDALWLGARLCQQRLGEQAGAASGAGRHEPRPQVRRPGRRRRASRSVHASSG